MEEGRYSLRCMLGRVATLEKKKTGEDEAVKRACTFEEECTWEVEGCGAKRHAG